MPFKVMTMKLYHDLHTKQKGAALIAVLIILTIITLLGVTAMRMGLTSLSLATNSQVSQLLFQSADFGTSSFVNTIIENPAEALTTGGIAGNTVGEVTYCVTAVAGAVNVLTAGACNLSSEAGFVSERKIVATEVTAVRVDVTDATSSFTTSVLSFGSDNVATGVPQKLKVYSTAVVPSFGSASIADINTCLSEAVLSDDDEESNKDVVTKTDCLTDAGAVFTTHVSEYLIGQ